MLLLFLFPMYYLGKINFLKELQTSKFKKVYTYFFVIVFLSTRKQYKRSIWLYSCGTAREIHYNLLFLFVKIPFYKISERDFCKIMSSARFLLIFFKISKFFSKISITYTLFYTYLGRRQTCPTTMMYSGDFSLGELTVL